ncbi:MAG: peptide chain release factor N(5)-glutamine methyltransferase [bacterium]|nr:peptide chain release factor N(5)-glutamine methyltransferase [bacterium]
MTIGSWLRSASDALKAADIPTPVLDSQVILANTISEKRTWILAHPEVELGTDVHRLLTEMLNRRIVHEPMAYILGKSEFYGREFAVNEHTLQPRPESEAMIELLIEQVNKIVGIENRDINIIDVGTGTGALGITTYLELLKLKTPISNLQAHLTDIDQKCIQTAKHNALSHGVEATFYTGDLLKPFSNMDLKGLIVILANLPYVPDSHTINKAAMHEPKHAIFGGPDGLDYYRALYYQVANLSQFDSKNVIIFTESLPQQHAELTKIASMAGFKQTAESDFIQVFAKA